MPCIVCGEHGVVEEGVGRTAGNAFRVKVMLTTIKYGPLVTSNEIIPMREVSFKNTRMGLGGKAGC